MDRLKSRKLWISIITAILVIANEGLDLNLPKEEIMTISGIAMSYILGQSYVDGKEKET